MLLGATWSSAIEFSARAYISARLKHLIGKHLSVPIESERVALLLKEYVSGRAWKQVVALHAAYGETIEGIPEIQCCRLLAHISLKQDGELERVLDSVKGTPDEDWIVTKALLCALCLGMHGNILELPRFVGRVRAEYRQVWVGALWDVVGNRAAVEELKDVAITDMGRLERRIWIHHLIYAREFGAASVLLEQWDDLVGRATMLHYQEKWNEALDLYERLAQSDDRNERVFGERGVAAVQKRVKS